MNKLINFTACILIIGIFATHLCIAHTITTDLVGLKPLSMLAFYVFSIASGLGALSSITMYVYFGPLIDNKLKYTKNYWNRKLRILKYVTRSARTNNTGKKD